MKSFHILIICYSYAPALSPRAFRWSAIAEYWAKQGHHVDVVCGWKPGVLHSEILNGVHVYRTGGKITEFVRDKFSIKKNIKKHLAIRKLPQVSAYAIKPDVL